MDMTLKKISDFKSTTWSGGQTTEIFIYPPNASYPERDFLFRLSSATVNDEKSTFTKLPDIKRKLLVLDGKMRLNHNNKEGKWLRANDQESFLGDWHTESEGLVVDYNLMTKGEIKGEIEAVQLAANDKEHYLVYIGDASKCFIFLYVWEGEITVETGYEKEFVKEKELVFIELDENIKLTGLLVESLNNAKARFVKTIIHI
jgi:environmental stress-induced protein Ves